MYVKAVESISETGIFCSRRLQNESPLGSGGAGRCTPLQNSIESSLEELCSAFQVEAVQTSYAVSCFEAEEVAQIPINHRCEPLELASGDQSTVNGRVVLRWRTHLAPSWFIGSCLASSRKDKII